MVLGTVGSVWEAEHCCWARRDLWVAAVAAVASRQHHESKSKQGDNEKAFLQQFLIVLETNKGPCIQVGWYCATLLLLTCCCGTQPGWAAPAGAACFGGERKSNLGLLVLVYQHKTPLNAAGTTPQQQREGWLSASGPYHESASV